MITRIQFRDKVRGKHLSHSCVFVDEDTGQVWVPATWFDPKTIHCAIFDGYYRVMEFTDEKERTPCIKLTWLIKEREEFNSKDKDFEKEQCVLNSLLEKYTKKFD